MSTTTLLRDYLLPLLHSLARWGFRAGFLAVFIYFVLATLLYLWNDPHAPAQTAALAAAVAPWIVATCATAALGQLAASMVRMWLEDHGGLPRSR
ncbi:hypothetical protein [Xanthomonas albilineans]|uniref:hypothetical protein n=1 Tax=Xanthomonas albilineans TaxID=29447 RepID=UPI0005F31BB3|nr:hypothetical protein [Xanthomonas albilineans]